MHEESLGKVRPYLGLHKKLSVGPLSLRPVETRDDLWGLMSQGTGSCLLLPV